MPESSSGGGAGWAVEFGRRLFRGITKASRNEPSWNDYGRAFQAQIAANKKPPSSPVPRGSDPYDSFAAAMKGTPAQKKPKMSKNPKPKKKKSLLRTFATWYDGLPGVVKDGINQGLMNAATMDYRAGPAGNRVVQSPRARAQNKPAPLSKQRGFVDTTGRFLNPLQVQKELAKPPGKTTVPGKTVSSSPTPRGSQNVRQRTAQVPIGTQATDDLQPILVPERVKYGNGGLGQSLVDRELERIVVTARRVGSGSRAALAVPGRDTVAGKVAGKVSSATRAGSRSATAVAGGISLDPFIRDILKLATTRTSPARQPARAAFPSLQSVTGQLAPATQLLTQFAPAKIGNKTDTCECDEKEKKKRKPRQARVECWSGTYKQRGKGISYHKREQIPCQ